MRRSCSRTLGSALWLALAGTAAGCQWVQSDPGPVDTGAQLEAAKIPDTVEGFLAELAPLPGAAQAVRIDYRVSGPALSGELHTLLAPGGLRHDRWELRTSAGDSFLTASGTSIISATQLWTGSDGEPGELRPNTLAGLGKAYLARDEDTRAKIIASIRAWHSTLAEQRERAGGEQDEIAQTPCLRTRIAAQNVCMWEEAGVMLAFEGSAFTIEATKVDREATLETDSFALPPLAARATKVEDDEHSAAAYEPILDELAAGSHAKVALLVYANLGLPKLELPAPEPKEAPAPEPKAP